LYNYCPVGANNVLWGVASAFCRTQAFMSLMWPRVAGKLDWQAKLLACIPYLEQRRDPV